MRLVRDVVGTPILASEVEVGDLVNAAPEALFPTEENGYEELHGAQLQVDKAKGAIIIVRMDPKDITPLEGREKWTVDGIICYSKICTHVGCPISLYERTTHHVLCPCHQSTFDLADHAKVVFGPAARPLPQLPLAVDEEGYLVAQSDFTEPIGASYWEREKQ
jgi:ubiquinol-cytochrome c reductase iron-sulfur subunit